MYFVGTYVTREKIPHPVPHLADVDHPMWWVCFMPNCHLLETFLV